MGQEARRLVGRKIEGVDKGSAKEGKVRKSWRRKPKERKRKRESASSCENGRDEGITEAWRGENQDRRKGRQPNKQEAVSAKFKWRKRSEDGSRVVRKATRKKRQLKGKSQLEEKSAKN